MKKYLFLLLFLCLILSSAAFAQTRDSPSLNHAKDALQEMQKEDPSAAHAFQTAIQKGDLAGAKQIYQDFKKKHPSEDDLTTQATATTTAAEAPSPPSLFERALAGEMLLDPTARLHQFGYDLFNKTISSFQPALTMPVGPDYQIGPGDQFTMTLWGTTEGIFTLEVTKEGKITLPKVGVISVAGVRFGELERTLKRHLSKYYTNFNLSVAMGGLKTITVYVVGDVANPGSYSLPSLATMYGALFAAGGPTKQGSLRMIQIVRSGKVIRTVDLYDFLLKGNRSQDLKLQNEDTVFVPLIGAVAAVDGMVLRPAIYELKGQETLNDVIDMAGGILPPALGGRLQLVRYEDNRKKVILDIKLDATVPGKQKSQKSVSFSEKVRNMDLITIRPIYNAVWENVNLNGAVAHPGDYQWRPGLRLREIIELGGLLPVSDMRRAEIIRLSGDFSDREVIPVDLGSLMNGDEEQNMPLQAQDLIRVYTTYRQADRVLISGEVVRPGNYEIMNGERLSDLLRRVGGFTGEAYVYGTVFKRRHVRESESKNLSTLISKLQSQMLQSAAESSATAISAEEAAFARSELSLNQGLLENLKAMQKKAEGRVAIAISGMIDDWAGSKDDLLLQAGDDIFIPKQPQEVLILGEVYTPGAQIHQPNMTVGEYIEKTGGFTKFAENKSIFVVQADGFAYGANSPSVGKISKMKLNPGDAVFVPQKLERQATLRTTRDIVDILFKTAVVLATITIIF